MNVTLDKKPSIAVSNKGREEVRAKGYEKKNDMIGKRKRKHREEKCDVEADRSDSLGKQRLRKERCM